MKIYLAARFSRRAELQGYAEQLVAAGYDVVSHWVSRTGDAKPYDGDPERNEEFASYAYEDGRDVMSADVLVQFGDAGVNGGGGKHVEMGIALALGKPVLVVGVPENIFHHLPTIGWVNDWEGAMVALKDLADVMAGRRGSCE